MLKNRGRAGASRQRLVLSMGKVTVPDPLPFRLCTATAGPNQVIAPVTAPVTVGAVSAAVLGDSTAINKDGGYKDGKSKGSAVGPRINAVTSGDHSIASGNQVIAPVTAPVTVGAVSAAVLGDSTAINKNGGNHKDGGYKDGE